jgi:glycerol kinase
MLMQLQADLLGVRVIRPVNAESTALGAAYLAGLGVGYWSSIDSIAQQWQIDKTFTPTMSNEARAAMLSRWHKALGRARSWEGE